MPAPPRHALLLGGDPRFLEALQKVLGAAWAGCAFHRAHPSGALTTPRIAMAQPGAIAVVDRRFVLKPELARLIGQIGGAGARVVAVRPVPASLRDLDSIISDDGFDLLSHDLSWDSPRIGQAIVAALGDRSLATLSGEAGGDPFASGESLVGDPMLKSSFISDLSTQLGQAGIQRTWRSKISNVVDELLMNALYHAGKGSGQGTSAAHVRWRLDASGFSATVSDEHGSYLRAQALRKIVDYQSQEMVEITRTRGRGGGVGLFLVLKAVTDYHLYVAPGARTEVSIRMTQMVKERRRETLIYLAAR